MARRALVDELGCVGKNGNVVGETTTVVGKAKRREWGPGTRKRMTTVPVLCVDFTALSWRFLGLELHGEVVVLLAQRVALGLVLSDELVDGLVAPVVGHFENPVLLFRIIDFYTLFVGEMSAERFECWRELFVERAALVVCPAIDAKPLSEQGPLSSITDEAVLAALERCCWWRCCLLALLGLSSVSLRGALFSLLQLGGRCCAPRRSSRLQEGPLPVLGWG